jgi:hypothetical protein
LAAGWHDPMLHYMSLFDHIDSYYAAGIMFHPETLLRHHLSNVVVNRIQVPWGLRNFWPSPSTS